MEALFDGAVEGFDLRGGISGGLGTEVHDVAIGGVELEVGGLKLVEALDEESRADEQHQRERGLEDDERALQPGGSAGDGSVSGAERVGGLGSGSDPGGGDAEQNAGDEGEREGESDDHRRRAGSDREVRRVREGEHEQHVRACVCHDKPEQATHGGD